MNGECVIEDIVDEVREDSCPSSPDVSKSYLGSNVLVLEDVRRG